MLSFPVDFREEVRSSLRYLGNNIVKLDGLINHQVLTRFMTAVGAEFAKRFSEAGITDVTKVLTAEASGIAPAFATAQALDVPMIYARKGKPVTMTGKIHSVEVRSRTKGGVTRLFVSGDYLARGDRVVVVDDILGYGEVIAGLGSLVRRSGADLRGIGCIVEKCFENGRATLESLSVPIVTLVKLKLLDDTVEVL